MEQTLITTLTEAFSGGMSTFFSLVDFPFMITIMIGVFLSNLVLPVKSGMPLALQWVAMHRYRVPLIALIVSITFLVLRDYGNYGRELVFTYFLTLTFSMCFNLWFLDQPADWVARKYPLFRVLLKGHSDSKNPTR